MPLAETWNGWSGETKSTFKTLFFHYSNPQQAQGKELDVSQFRRDQSELYTTAATVNAASFHGTSGSGSILPQLCVCEEVGPLEENTDWATDKHLFSPSLCIPATAFPFLITKGFQTPELPRLHFSCSIGLGCPYGNYVAALERQQNHFLQFRPPAGSERARGRARTNKKAGENYAEKPKMAKKRAWCDKGMASLWSKKSTKSNINWHFVGHLLNAVLLQKRLMRRLWIMVCGDVSYRNHIDSTKVCTCRYRLLLFFLIHCNFCSFFCVIVSHLAIIAVTHAKPIRTAVLFF